MKGKGRSVVRPLMYLFGVLFSVTASAPIGIDGVDELVATRMRERGIQGLSLAVVKKGKIIKVRGYGLSNVELNVQAGPQTVYRIASTGKLFVATGIMLLAEENKLSLDDSINKYLASPPEAWRGITIRQLLAHTSGLSHDAPGYDDFKVQSEADVIKSAYADPLLFTPGTNAAYSNLGYFILADIITRASGERWCKYLDEKIFKPLRMTATDTTNSSDIVMGRATGYARNSGKLQNAPIPIALRPSGAFLSSVLDLAKFDSALYSEHLLKQSSLRQMWQPVKETDTGEGAVKGASFGLGWVVAQVNGHRVVLKGGSYPGFNAAFARFIDDSVTIILLANTDKARVGTLQYEVANFYVHSLAYTDTQ